MQKFPPGLCHSETEFEILSGSISYVFGTECTIQDIDIKYYGQRNTLLVNSVFTTQLALLMLNVQENQIFW